MSHRTGAADVVETVEMAIQQNGCLPFRAEHALRSLRLPNFFDSKLVTLWLEGEENAAVVFARADEDVAIDRQRNGDVAVVVGLVGMAPQQAARIRRQADRGAAGEH